MNEIEIRLVVPDEITTGLDPHLQSAILQNRAGDSIDSAFSHRDEEGTVFVDVVAKLRRPGADVDGLRVTTRINHIVTGTVAVNDLEAVRAHPDIASLKRATRLHPELEFSVSEVNATEDQLTTGLPAGTTTPDGTDVIVGVVDYDFDFQHNNFRNTDGSTRLRYLWDQRGGSTGQSPQPYNYGREFSRSEINDALNKPDPYQAIAYRPEPESHGTHVSDIAVGNGRATGDPGVASNADVIFVNISHDDTVDEIDDLDNDETQSFGNSKLLLEAIDYIFRKADSLGRQAVVNVSLGTRGGPHDGTTLVEQGFDELLDKPGRAIVIAAGNSHQLQSHAQGEVSDSSSRTLTWIIPTVDNSDNEVEIWYPGGTELQIALETPAGTRLNPVLIGTTRLLATATTNVGRIVHRAGDPNNSDNHIDIVLDKSLFGGSWKIHLTSVSSTPVPFHAWIERDNGVRSRFSPSDNVVSHTLGSISCGQRTIVVGSYLSSSQGREISLFSGEGPTRDGRQKPEISAPGQSLPSSGIRAASSRSQGTTRKSGTSMAAPHVAGLIALMMSAAGRTLSNDEIREGMIETARRNPPDGNGWDPRYGFGRIDALQAIAEFLPSPSPVPTSSVPTLVASNAEPLSASGIADIISVVSAEARRSNVRVKFNIEVEPA